jgi:uncharacterized protein (TIGR02594 family)
MNLPEQYQWLTKLKGLPKTIQVALSFFGVQEVVGKGSNKTIISWRDQLNQAGVKIAGFSDDDIAWCGLLAAIVCYLRMKIATEVVKDPLWARNWAKYGKPAKVAMLGDVLVFHRGEGGHVAFYIGEDSKTYHAIGGNQSNKVCITRIPKNRLIAVRRPPYATDPAAMKQYFLEATGSISTNEA